MSSSTRTLRRSWHLLARYLRPHRLPMALLAVTLIATISVQVATPLIASRFINEATGGGAMRTLVDLALLTMALAVAGQ
ncbi:MAG: ABC transporter ATP-binding protein, partial [Chloroflexota bacterium]|nr:ABC transporter ATP-binding protein [Chloroflexota bacterium]